MPVRAALIRSRSRSRQSARILLILFYLMRCERVDRERGAVVAMLRCNEQRHPNCVARGTDSGRPVRSVEAVTIVREIVTRIVAGSIAGVPSPQIIRLSRDGRIAVEGPIAADARTVTHAAHLLSALLPGFDVRTTDRVPGALRLIIARAARTFDLPPYPSLEAFAADLCRFAASDAEQCVRDLLANRHTTEDVSVEAVAVAVNGAASNHALTHLRYPTRASRDRPHARRHLRPDGHSGRSSVRARMGLPRPLAGSCGGTSPHAALRATCRARRAARPRCRMAAPASTTARSRRDAKASSRHRCGSAGRRWGDRRSGRSR